MSTRDKNDRYERNQNEEKTNQPTDMKWKTIQQLGIFFLFYLLSNLTERWVSARAP